MKDKLTKDLDIKAFLVVYSIISIVAHVALCHLFVNSYEFLIKSFLEEHEIPAVFLADKFPSGSAIIAGLFIAIKIFMTKILNKDICEKSRRCLSAVIEADFTFLLIFLTYIVFYYVNEFVILIEYGEPVTPNIILTLSFLVTLILIAAYNYLTLCALRRRKELFSENGVFHFFINPITTLLTLAGLIMEFIYILTLNTHKFKTQWWEFVYPSALYAICFIFLILLAKKSKLTPDLSKRIFTTTVILTLSLRLLFVCICLSVWGFSYTPKLLIVLFMTTPCLAGAFVAKRITNKKQ